MSARKQQPHTAAPWKFARWWVLLFGGLVALGLFYHRPQWQRCRQQQQLLLQLQQQARQLQQENRRLSQVQRELEQARHYLAQQQDRHLLISPEELVARCVGVLSAAQVQIRQFRRRELRKRPSLQEIWLEVECLGELPQVFQVIARLEQLPQPVWIENLRLTPAGEESPEVQCHLLLRGFTGNLQESG